jgi:transposase
VPAGIDVLPEQRDPVCAISNVAVMKRGQTLAKTAVCQSRHRHQEFLKSLRKIDRSVPAGLAVHIVLDNYGTHNHEAVRNWLGDRPRYPLHFTPTGPSWLNLVERFFAEITHRRIRRGTFRSVPELIAAILDYIRNRNKQPKPFLWTAKASDIIRKVRNSLGTQEAGHQRGSASDQRACE